MKSTNVIILWTSRASLPAHCCPGEIKFGEEDREFAERLIRAGHMRDSLYFKPIHPAISLRVGHLIGESSYPDDDLYCIRPFEAASTMLSIYKSS